jgi:hypothetical protein
MPPAGTSMLERTYSALISNHSDTALRANMLDLDAPAEGNVVPITRAV